MQQHLLIQQHIDHEGPGLLLQLLEEHSIPFDIVNLTQDSIRKADIRKSLTLESASVCRRWLKQREETSSHAR